MIATYADALSQHNVEIPEHLVADAMIPVLTELQVQGDVIIEPVEFEADTTDNWGAVPAAGVQVVRGEATRNTHWLNNGNPDGPPCLWRRVNQGLTLGLLEVPAGQTAFLTHTDEHGSNGIGAGCYRIGRQREKAEEVRMVAD